LVHALNSYKSGERKNAIMSGFAAGLTSQDIIDLSTYYSKQKGLNIIPKN
jgi:cytochrome c553